MTVATNAATDDRWQPVSVRSFSLSMDASLSMDKEKAITSIRDGIDVMASSMRRRADERSSLIGAMPFALTSW
jgi:hypothetical protein